MRLLPTGIQSTNLAVIGTVENVIAGIVPAQAKNHRYESDAYRYGFELGSPHSLESMGEAVLVNGHCFATSTDPHHHHLQTISGSTFFSTGMFLIPQAAKPSYTLAPTILSSGVKYPDFINTIYETVQRACTVVALLRFHQVKGAYLQKAPIYGENMFDRGKNYLYPKTLTFENCDVFLIGVTANIAKNDALLLNALKVVLYDNPFDVKQNLLTHTHALILTHSASHPDEIHPEMVGHTIHLLNADSVPSEIIWGEVYCIDQINKINQ